MNIDNNKPDNNKIERAAVRAVEECIDNCPRLEPTLKANDKTKTWDGEIRIDCTDKHQVGNLLARVPLQIKGTTDTSLNSYRLERKYLKEYQADGGCVLFVVHVEKKKSKYNVLKVLYTVLSLNDVNIKLEQKTKTINIKLKRVPTNPDDFENELISFATKRMKLPIENPAPSEIASLVNRFTDLENHLDKEVKDDGKKIELRSFIDSIKGLKNDGTYGWRDTFVHLSRIVLNYFIQYVPKYDVLDLQIELGNYLCQQKLYHLVGNYYSLALEKCRKHAKKSPDYNVHVADILNNLAGMHWNNNQLDVAESELEEALRIYIELEKDSPNTYLANIAKTLNNLAILHKSIKRLGAAETEYQAALDIYRKLTEYNSKAYMADVAMILTNLGILHSNINKDTAAEGEFNEALEIYIKLAEDNPNAYQAEAATTLNSFATLYMNLNKYDLAESKYKAALEIRKKIAKDNRKAYPYQADVAMTLNNLGLLHSGLESDAVENTKAAEDEFNEALETYINLSEVNHDAYSCYVATTLNHLGLLHWKTDQFSIAETELKEALEIDRKLVEDNQDAYLADLAMTLNNLGIVHKYLNLRRTAEDEYNEALKIRQKLAHANPDTYTADVAKTLFNKAKLLMLDEHRKDDAKQACEEALNILNVMVQKAPQRFNKSVDKVQELLDIINGI